MEHKRQSNTSVNGEFKEQVQDVLNIDGASPFREDDYYLDGDLLEALKTADTDLSKNKNIQGILRKLSEDAFKAGAKETLKAIDAVLNTDRFKIIKP